MLPLECDEFSNVFAGSDWRYQSNTDQSYKYYGAYYDRVRGKLQVKNEPRNKVKLNNILEWRGGVGSDLASKKLYLVILYSYTENALIWILLFVTFCRQRRKD